MQIRLYHCYQDAALRYWVAAMTRGIAAEPLAARAVLELLLVALQAQHAWWGVLLYPRCRGHCAHDEVTPSWGVLVDELCALWRLVEAGVTVKIEGTSTVLTTGQDFYEWAHGRYHKLADGYDRRIGDDN